MDSHVDAIMRAYVEGAGGDHKRALREVICDAIADLLEAERRTMRAERLISKGYVRGVLRAPVPLQGHRRASVG